MKRKIVSLILLLVFLLVNFNTFVFCETSSSVVLSVAESSESYSNATGGAETVYTDANGKSYISFNAGDYQVFDFNIETSGTYIVTVYAGLSEEGPASALSFYNSAKQSYEEVSRKAIVPSGSYSAYGPTVMGEFELTAGANKIKLTQTYSDIHLSYVEITYKSAPEAIAYSVAESTESHNASDGSTEKILTNSKGSYSQFSQNDYYIFDVTVPYSGDYEITLYSALKTGSAETEIYVYNELTASYELKLTEEIVVNGSLLSFGPTVMGKITLKVGTNKLKVLQKTAEIRLSKIEALYQESGKTEKRDVRESSDSCNNSTGAKESFIKNDNGYFVSFNTGDTQDFVFNLNESGTYSITVYAGLVGKAESAVYIFDEKTGTYKELVSKAITPSGDLSVFGATEMGEFNLEKGINKIRVKQISADMHFHAIELKCMKLPEPIELSVKESLESYNNGTQAAETVYTDASGTPYISFNYNDYQIFDFELERSGRYRISLIAGLGAEGPISSVSVYNEETMSYDELTKGLINPSGSLTVYGETALGEFNLVAGKIKLKVSQVYSDIHFSGIKVEYVGTAVEEVEMDALSYTAMTATQTEDTELLLFDTPQYADYTVDIPVGGNYEVTAFVSECYIREPQISLWENNVELVSARIPNYVLNDVCMPLTLGTVNLKAGEHNFRVRHSGVTASHFYFERLLFTRVSPEKSVTVSGVTILTEDMATDTEKVTVQDSGNAVIAQHGFLKYDSLVAETGYYRFDITCASNTSADVVVAANEEVIGYVNIDEGKGMFIGNLTKGQQILEFSVLSDIELEKINITYLPYVVSELETDFTESINSAKYAKDIKRILEEYSEVFLLDLEELESGVFYKDAIYAGLIGRDFNSSEDIIRELEALSEQEKTSPCVLLKNGDEKITALTSGNLSLTVSSAQMRENMSVFVAIYRNNALYKIYRGDYDGTISDVVIPMGNLTIDGTETIKIISLNNMTDIMPVNMNSNTELEIFVSPSGNDENSGTKASPIKTIGKAQELVAQANADMTGDIIVNLDEGVYYEGKTLVFDETQSGMNGYNVIWQGSGENTVISGGVKITDWQAAGGGIYKAPFGGAEDVRNLYVDGYPATKAKSESAFWVEETYTSDDAALTFDGLVVEDEYFPTAFAKPQDLEVVLDKSWETQRFPVENVLFEGAKATILLDETVLAHNTVVEGTALGAQMMIYIENAKELLDEPGEFYYDKEEGYIYYYPLETETINSCEIYVPTVEGIVSVGGASTDSKAKNLVFKDMSFKNGTWNYPSTGGYIGTQSDVFTDTQTGNTDMIFSQFAINNAEFIKIENCVLSCLGSNGIGVRSGAENIEIVGNRFRDIAASGIYAGDAAHSETENTAERVKNILIENNSFTRTSFEFRSCSAVSLYYVNDVTITHNSITDLPYSGMTAGWGWGATDPEGWGNITIKNNSINNVMQSLDDGGGVYLLGHMRNSNITGNHFNKVGRVSSSMYADSGTGYAQFKGNVSTNTRQWLTIANIGLHDVRVRNNYSDTSRGLITSGEYINEGNVTDISADNLPAEAQAIVDSAGVEKKYQHLTVGNELPEGRITMVFNAPKLPYYEGYKFEAEDCKSYTSGVVYANSYLGFNQNSSAAFDVTVEKAGTYRVRAFTATPSSDSQVAILQNGSITATATAINTGSYGIYKMLDVGEITLAKGTSELTIKSTKNAFHVDCFVLEPVE